jgi:ribosomal protein S18 acetylase RimI-like enzyme
VTIRPLRSDEAARLRELRLRALREDPRAFAESFEAASALEPEQWESWTSAGGIIVAIDGERWVGMVACRMLDESPTSSWLSALWVDPSVRGTGLGACLVDAVDVWSRENGATTVELSVTTNNEAAVAFYARVGFEETGRRRPLPADPSRTEVFLSRPVRP